LFARYPGLASKIPYVRLGTFPTPVEHASELGGALGIADLYIKHDDRSGDPYGGNKVRKLELVLADAVAQGKDAVLTFGGVGSNHALATTIYARKLGLRTILDLLPEPPSAHVRQNLLAELGFGAELHLTSPQKIDELLRQQANGTLPAGSPYVIAPGGSSLLGNVGFVNAAFELADQIARAELPTPDVVYITMGTSGSAVGLAIGLKAAGLKTEVRGVRASSTKYVSAAVARAMAEATVALLRDADPTFPNALPELTELRIVHSQVGKGYAMPTPQGEKARALAQRLAGLELDLTYTAKTFAALVADAPSLRGRVVLYWHTYDGRPLDVSQVRPEDLPKDLRSYARGKTTAKP